ncbi:hypothetical protein J3459_006588 [Metarhizium acridum]|nr:hypothetical protein J3459_006588 [Metarhizium acridum]
MQCRSLGLPGCTYRPCTLAIPASASRRADCNPTRTGFSNKYWPGRDGKALPRPMRDIRLDAQLWKRTVGTLPTSDNPQLPPLPHGEMSDFSRHGMLLPRWMGAEAVKRWNGTCSAYTFAAEQRTLLREEPDEGHVCAGAMPSGIFRVVQS